MNIAVIKTNICIDAADFESLYIANSFLESGVWPGADAVTPLPDGYGIGDSYHGGVWTAKPVPPEPEPPDPPDPPEPEPGHNDFIAGLMEGLKNE